jgi:hypothetical protein
LTKEIKLGESESNINAYKLERAIWSATVAHKLELKSEAGAQAETTQDTKGKKRKREEGDMSKDRQKEKVARRTTTK